MIKKYKAKVLHFLIKMIGNYKSIIEKALNFIEKEKYSSFDPFDVLLSSFVDKLTHLARRLAIQINRKLLFNVRPLLGIPKKVHTKILSDMLSVYSLLYSHDNQKMHLEKAQAMYTWLMERKIILDESIAWGADFPYTTRFTNIGYETPNLFNTLNSANSLLDYYDISRDVSIKKNIVRIISSLYKDLGIVYPEDNIAWIRYYPKQTIPVLNVNASAASTFIRVNETIKEDIVPQTDITKILALLKSHQNPDGSWYYTSSKDGQWIDGFHSGYIIESLAYIKSVSHTYDIDEMLIKGVNFYINNLFSFEGIPKYYHDKLYPIESQNCAQAIQTLAKLSLYLKIDTKDLLNKVISRTLYYLYNPDGYFYYKREKYFTNKQFYIRWSQTPMILALLYAQKCCNTQFTCV